MYVQIKMHIRNIVKAGEASFTVSLPKNWIEKNKLKKGDKIYLLEKNDQEILITPFIDNQPQTEEKKEIVISVDGKELDTVQREITSAYLNNYSTIKISGNTLPSKTKSIREALHDFVALEISEQTSNTIIAKDLLNLKEISVDKTVRRMDMIIRTMLNDALKPETELKETIHFRDYDVNRMYFLLVRLMKNAISNKKAAQEFNLENEQILIYWYLTINLENLADYIKTLTLKKMTKKENELVEKTLKNISTTYEEIMNSFYKKDKKLADEVARKRKSMLEQAEKLPPGLMETMNSMITVINNIARIVMDFN